MNHVYLIVLPVNVSLTNVSATRIPIHEQSFLSDQRSTRLMFISSVDKTLSRSIHSQHERAICHSNRKCKLGAEYRYITEWANKETTDVSHDDSFLAEIQAKMQKNLKIDDD